MWLGPGLRCWGDERPVLPHGTNSWFQPRTRASPPEVPGGIEELLRGRIGDETDRRDVTSPEDWDELSVVIGIESPDRLKRQLLVLPDQHASSSCATKASS